MKYKLVALDLDGTLFNDNSEISEYTKDVLHRVETLGVKIVIATGRSYTSLKPKIHKLKLEHPVICYNGAMIRDGKTDEVIQSSTVNPVVVKELIRVSREKNIYFHVFKNGQFYYEIINEHLTFYQNLSGLDGVKCNFDSFDLSDLSKCMFIGQHNELLTVQNYLNPIFSDQAYIAFSKPYFLEIMDITASKSKALDYLAKGYNISRDEIIAFGDGLNDVDMLRYAGKGVAMKNGFESLFDEFEKSEFTNHQDGVAIYLEKLLNGK